MNGVTQYGLHVWISTGVRVRIYIENTHLLYMCTTCVIYCNVLYGLLHNVMNLYYTTHHNGHTA